MPNAHKFRTVRQVVAAQARQEGAGVQIFRTIGTSELQNWDPFLLLDELKQPANLAVAGFPDHPHRGFQTCSIMLKGAIEHKDSAGNTGIIRDGGVQWMTAGRGIVHSEMPKQTTGDLWGFQLWVNLPARDKMIRPRYQDFQVDSIPIVKDANGGWVRVMAGTYWQHSGPIELRTPGLLLDICLHPGSTFEHNFEEDWNALAYVYDGGGEFHGYTAVVQHAYVFGQGDGVMAAARDQWMRFLLIAGEPLREPIVQHGPFVMNNMDEIRQAYKDYRDGRLQNPGDNVWERHA